MNREKRVVLIACLGTSPAVLTETVWALAHQERPIVPDEIVVIVTKSGKERLCRDVFSGEPTIWDSMLAALKKEKIPIDGKLVFGETSIRVIPDEKGDGIRDLRTGDDNLRAADFMLRQIRQYTEASDTVVLTSIAGGRKTMSALLFSCMTLLGREDDKVYHVLLPPEFEGGVEPPLFYPKKGVTYTNRTTGKKYKGDRYQSELFEVPFVRMRGWYQEKFKSIPPSYKTLVSSVQAIAPAATLVNRPKLAFDFKAGRVFLQGGDSLSSRIDLDLAPTEFVALSLSVVGKISRSNLTEAMMAMKLAMACGFADWRRAYHESSRHMGPGDVLQQEDDTRKILSQLRQKLKLHLEPRLVDEIVPKRSNPILWPEERMSADVQAYQSVFGV